MFIYDEENDDYTMQLNGILFSCEEEQEEYEEWAEELSEAYYENLPEIIDFMLPEIQDIFGEELTAAEVGKNLGIPEIDLDNELLMYCNHSFDEDHMFTIEFGSDFEELYDFYIDG